MYHYVDFHQIHTLNLYNDLHCIGGALQNPINVGMVTLFVPSIRTVKLQIL